MGKQFFYNILVFSSVAFLAGCSTNPATGEKQFTALMSPQEEDTIGAEMHEKVVKQEELYKDTALQTYVNEVGGRIVRGSERPDVLYKFFVLDTPIVNAYASPGGYIYLSRGILALMNNEAEMASVIAHEIGHITGRHMAERYSRGTLTAIGTAVLSIALGGEQGIANALGLGESLYMRSYSRGQENEADTLGMRYMSRAGYDSRGSAVFLKNLKVSNDFQQRVDGESAQADLPDLLSTHPATEERIAKTSALITAYPSGGDIKADEYLRKINGMVYGDSENQGFLKGQVFYHPHIGFKFSFPQDYRVMNQTENVIGISKSGILVAFDMMNNKKGKTPIEFLKQDVMEGEPLSGVEDIDVNGLKAATGMFAGQMDGKPVTLRLMVIAWNSAQIARFQILVPDGAGADEIEELKRMTYSFTKMTKHEKDSIKPYRLSVVKAVTGDTQQSLGARMAIPDFKQEWFGILNGLALNERIVAGKLYKLITE